MSSLPKSPGHSGEQERVNTLKRLLGDIQKAVSFGDFQAAEKLREDLIKTDPNAIKAAIKAAEIIESGKSAAIDLEHLSIWAELYSQLTVEERNSLFHGMKKHILPEKKILLKDGAPNDRLFFIEKGEVIVGLARKGEKFKVLANIGPGEILGEYTFATMALCSATAVTKTEVQFRCLEGEEAERLDKKHNGLYNKLIDFCFSHGRVEEITKSKEQQGHTHKRHPALGKVHGVVLDKHGQKTEARVNGDLEEISRSGTSFTIHCNKRAVAKQLLAKSLALEFTCKVKGGEVRFTAVGRVVKVSFLLYSDYVLHVGFQKRLAEEVVARLIS